MHHTSYNLRSRETKPPEDLDVSSHSTEIYWTPEDDDTSLLKPSTKEKKKTCFKRAKFSYRVHGICKLKCKY